MFNILPKKLFEEGEVYDSHLEIRVDGSSINPGLDADVVIRTARFTIDVESGKSIVETSHRLSLAEQRKLHAALGKNLLAIDESDRQRVKRYSIKTKKRHAAAVAADKKRRRK